MLIIFNACHCLCFSLKSIIIVAVLINCAFFPRKIAIEKHPPLLEEVVNKMRVRQSLPENPELAIKIGQMLLVGFRGLTVDEQHPVVQAIHDYHLSGVILFDYDVAQKQPMRNIQSPQQVKTLTATLQSFAPLPLLIAIDYEGGAINRLPEKYGFPATVSFQHLGNTGDIRLTARQATVMAENLENLGINLNMAPVVDLRINPQNPIIARLKRSFSADPAVVTQHALAFIHAHHQHHVLCTLKHFPGHGSSRKDSHLGLTDVTDTWSPIELTPYANLIQANVVDAIMTAHVFNAQLDSTYPATLSYATVTGLLRQKLNYQGVVLSDDMQMRAVTHHYGLEVALQKAVEAGVDIIVMGNNTGVFEEDIAERAFTMLYELATQGKISLERIDASYQRIRRLKAQLTYINQ